jgi:FeS assembly SUF system protein
MDQPRPNERVDVEDDRRAVEPGVAAGRLDDSSVVPRSPPTKAYVGPAPGGNGRPQSPAHGSNDMTNADAMPSAEAVPEGAPPPPEDGLSAVQRDSLAGIAEHPGLLGEVVSILRDIYDPEIPVNIYDLGLIYDVRELEAGRIYVLMTLTSPMCPVAESLPPEVRRRVARVKGVSEAILGLTWEPPWGPDKMSEAARLQLNFFY